MKSDTPSKHASPGFNLRSVPAYLLAKAVPGLIVFLSVPVFVHLFGSANYGQWARTWAVATAASAVGVGWIRQAVLREASSSRVSATLGPLPILISILVTALVVACVAWGGESPDLAFTASAGLFAATFAIYSVRLTDAQALQREWAFNVAELARTVLGLLGTVALGLSFGSASEWILLGNAFGNLAGFLIVSRLVHQAAIVRWQWRSAFDYGWPMSLWLGLSMMVLYTDRFIVGAFRSALEAGSYAAASDLVIRGTGMVLIPVTMAAHPQLMAAYNSGARGEAFEALRKWTRLMLAASFVSVFATIAGAVVLLPSRLLPNQVLVVSLLALAAAIWQISLLLHKPAELARDTRSMLRNISLAWVLGTIVGVAATQHLGGVGAALGTLTGATCYALLALRGSRRFDLRIEGP